jgi:putative tryptophan/tyrosine transport system substrate-binding protein
VKKKVVGVALSALLFALCVPAEAQQPKKVARIGCLSALTPSAAAPYIEAFRQGIRDLGYIEGQNIAIECRYAEEKLERQPALIAELLRLKVHIIVTTGATSTRSAMEATNTIPIVMAQDPDPIANGFVTTLSRPGGNVTGLSSLVTELGGKRLELLKEVVPRLSRVAVLGTSTNPANVQQLTETERAARPMGAKLQFLDILVPKDIETGFQAATKGRADAVLVLGSPILNSERTKIAQLAIKTRLPAMYSRLEFIEDGGLMTYGASIPDLYRRAATYVDKILKGTNPADLPVEQPTKFEFIVNLKAAKQIGLTIPPNVLARADKVIK